MRSPIAYCAPAMIAYQSMSRGIKLRLAAFVLAIMGMVVLIGWVAHSSWRRTGELREKLTEVQLQSFQIADHFQQSILELNNLVLRYGAYRHPGDWTQFRNASTNLDHWIDEQRPILSSEHEKHILDLINTNYDYYLAAAQELEPKVQTNAQSTLGLIEFGGFERQSRDILNLSIRLADAHGESMGAFLADSQRSLSYLRLASLTSLALLLLAGGGLAFVVYRELIAPLRVKLVESEALIARQEKLASLGLLAAGVAHEVRNPLTAIKAWLFLQERHLQAGTPEFEDARVISNEVNRLERIVREVLLFARPSEPRLSVVPGGEILRQVATLLGPQLDQADIRLELEDRAGASVRIDPQQLQQVLINLVQNAAESIGRGGVITLRTRRSTRRLGEQTTEVVLLEVADTGAGIPPEVEKRLFDPFFTTKESGTGLGLSIAARIVEKNGGTLQYQTQVNHGTTFGIAFPRVS
jgi:signal transduction histidine kinase